MNNAPKVRSLTMEARDRESKIRPLPIDEIDGGGPQDRPIETRRRWVPLFVIVVGAIAFGVIARGLDPGDPTVDAATASTSAAPISEPPEATTTTTSAAPPPPQLLRQLLPAAEEGLQLIATTNTSAKVGEWAPGNAAPEFNTRISQPRSASYNADGTRVAVHSSVRGGSIVIDSADGGGPIYIQGEVSGGAWHPSNPDLFAWTKPDSSSEADLTLLSIADIAGDDGTVLEPLIEVSISRSNHNLRAWGDWGFATTSSNTVFVFDADGEMLRRVESAFFDATHDGVLLLARFEAAAAIPYLLNPDGTGTDLIGLDIGAADLRITDDGEWVLAITYQADGHTSILARTVHSRSTRLTSIDETARIIDMVREDRFLVLQEVHSNDLVFKDWNTGAEFRVPVDDQIAAVDL